MTLFTEDEFQELLLDVLLEEQQNLPSEELYNIISVMREGRFEYNDVRAILFTGLLFEKEYRESEDIW